MLRVLYLHACPKLLGSDHDPGGEHCGPSASPGIFRAHLAHMDVIRSETVAAAALFWNSLCTNQMVGRLGDQNLLLFHSTAALHNTQKGFHKDRLRVNARGLQPFLSLCTLLLATNPRWPSVPQRGFKGKDKDWPFLLALTWRPVLSTFLVRYRFGVPQMEEGIKSGLLLP